MKNEVDFLDEWNLLQISGERRIHRDDIESITLSESKNSFIVTLKREKGLLFYQKDRCHFCIQ